MVCQDRGLRGVVVNTGHALQPGGEEVIAEESPLLVGPRVRRVGVPVAHEKTVTVVLRQIRVQHVPHDGRIEQCQERVDVAALIE